MMYSACCLKVIWGKYYGVFCAAAVIIISLGVFLSSSSIPGHGSQRANNIWTSFLSSDIPGTWYCEH
jgi:hypothetical protein